LFLGVGNLPHCASKLMCKFKWRHTLFPFWRAWKMYWHCFGHFNGPCILSFPCVGYCSLMSEYFFLSVTHRSTTRPVLSGWVNQLKYLLEKDSYFLLSFLIWVSFFTKGDLMWIFYVILMTFLFSFGRFCMKIFLIKNIFLWLPLPCF
jgi:hypothetical protein